MLQDYLNIRLGPPGPSVVVVLVSLSMGAVASSGVALYAAPNWYLPPVAFFFIAAFFADAQ